MPINGVNWLGDAEFMSTKEIMLSVKVRSTAPQEGNLRPLSPKSATVELLNPEEGVAPGQACVFYETETNAFWVEVGLLQGHKAIKIS